MINLEGVENRFEVPSIIANEALYRLKHHLVLPRLANRTFERYFENKIGDEITVKRPFKAKVQDGRRFKKSAMIDKSVKIQINRRHHFGLEAVDEDFTLNIVDYGARYLQAGAEELAYKFDIAGANELGLGLFLMNGTPGTALSLADGQMIRAHAEKMAIPENSQNFALLDPLDRAQISEHIHDVDMPEMVGENIRRKYKGQFADWGVLTSVHVPYLEVIGYGNQQPEINGASQRGDSITTDSWGNAAKKVLNKGQLIQIAGVGEVQPRGDRRPTGNPMTFMVTEDVMCDAAGAATIKIYPEINDGTADNTVANPAGQTFDGSNQATLDASAYQTVNRVAPDNADITVIGHGTGTDALEVGTTALYRQGIYFCGDALEYVNIELATPKSAVYAGAQVDEETGAAITYLADFDATDMTELERLDIFFGTKAVYPELGIRHIGAKVG